MTVPISNHELSDLSVFGTLRKTLLAMQEAASRVGVRSIGARAANISRAGGLAAYDRAHASLRPGELPPPGTAAHRRLLVEAAERRRRRRGKASRDLTPANDEGGPRSTVAGRAGTNPRTSVKADRTGVR